MGLFQSRLDYTTFNLQSPATSGDKSVIRSVINSGTRCLYIAATSGENSELVLDYLEPIMQRSRAVVSDVRLLVSDLLYKRLCAEREFMKEVNQRNGIKVSNRITGDYIVANRDAVVVYNEKFGGVARFHTDRLGDRLADVFLHRFEEARLLEQAAVAA